MLRVRGVETDVDAVRGRCDAASFGVSEMLRCANEMGLRSEVRTATWEDLAKTRLPAIASQKDGNFCVVGFVGNDNVIVVDQATEGRRNLSRVEFEAIWGG